MAGRHGRNERRRFREYVSAFFRDVESSPGYRQGFYGGIALLLLGIAFALLGIR